ncbi:hypothetical protein [Paraburkholderia sp. BR14320]|uniref:hypothetical protein n=1 Tax=unclassified Paraburkholderia TaxID=2615204 RepID=UPI0034CE715B
MAVRSKKTQSSNGTPTAQQLQSQNATLQQQVTSLSQFIQSLITAGTIPGANIPVGGGTATTPTVTATFDPAALPSGMDLKNSNATVVATVNAWQTARTTYGQSPVFSMQKRPTHASQLQLASVCRTLMHPCSS